VLAAAPLPAIELIVPPPLIGEAGGIVAVEPATLLPGPVLGALVFAVSLGPIALVAACVPPSPASGLASSVSRSDVSADAG
jgi:hypothetical protein